MPLTPTNAWPDWLRPKNASAPLAVAVVVFALVVLLARLVVAGLVVGLLACCLLADLGRGLLDFVRGV